MRDRLRIGVGVRGGDHHHQHHRRRRRRYVHADLACNIRHCSMVVLASGQPDAATSTFDRRRLSEPFVRRLDDSHGSWFRCHFVDDDCNDHRCHCRVANVWHFRTCNIAWRANGTFAMSVVCWQMNQRHCVSHALSYHHSRRTHRMRNLCSTNSLSIVNSVSVGPVEWGGIFNSDFLF